MDIYGKHEKELKDRSEQKCSVIKQALENAKGCAGIK